jgi:hypothetical protein
MHNRRPGGDRRRNWLRRSRYGFLLLRDRFQHVAGTRDMGQINLGLDFFFAAQRA